MKTDRIALVGNGGWGTALALLLLDPARRITLWGHDPAEIREMRDARENRVYLPGIQLPAALALTCDLGEAIAGAGLVVMAVPSRHYRAVADRLARAGPDRDAVLLTGTKGIEHGTGHTMSEILAECLPGHTVAALSGPSHAEEVARGLPTAVTLACDNPPVASALQSLLTGPAFRVYTSADVRGTELGGALKNIYALAAGVSDGLGLGDNTKAALVTRSLAEMIRLGVALGGRRDTFQGLSGIGDLMVTCFSRHSRNRLVGERLGRGESLAAIEASMRTVAEGVPTSLGARAEARRHAIDTPVLDQVCAIVHEQRNPRVALAELLARTPRPELD